jgi:endonuclease/exonuclease/phosphatase family metal-dependent hydrolase
LRPIGGTAVKRHPPLKVLSYNIHKGLSALNRKHVLHDIREAIRSVDPDLVFLQEVLGAHNRHSKRFKNWPQESQFEFLADSIWSHHAYGKNAVYDEGHHGNAVLSKYPILAWRNIDVSESRFESRGILHVVIDAPKPWGELHGMCVHLGLTGNQRNKQVSKLRRIVEEGVPHSAALLVAGDFNDWSVRASHRLAHELTLTEAFEALHGSPARTFPARLPLLMLDRIYSRHMRVDTGSVLFGKPWSVLSDHAALYAEFSHTHFHD